MRRFVISIVLVILLVSCKNYKKLKGEAEVISGNYGHKLSSAYRNYDNVKTPGYGMIVIKDRVIEHAAGYGMANIDENKPILSDSKFQSWILFNHAVKVSLLKMWEEGIVDLDAPITKYLTYLPNEYSVIKVKHVIDRTSGLPNILEEEFDGVLTVKELLGLVTQSKTLNYQPGTDYSFDGGFFEELIIASIIEELTGEDIETYINREVFQALNMTDSCVYSQKTYDKEDTKYYKRRARKFHPFVPNEWEAVGSCTTITTLEDLAKFFNALDYKEFISDKVFRLYNSITTLTDGTQALDTENTHDYFDGYLSPAGYLAVDKYNGNIGISFNAPDEATIHLPDDGYRIFVMTNHPEGRSDNTLYEKVIPAIFH